MGCQSARPTPASPPEAGPGQRHSRHSGETYGLGSSGMIVPMFIMLFGSNARFRISSI